MKKNIYLILILIASGNSLKAQIGINTEIPQTLFHVDPLRNNTGTTPSTAQQLDDVYFSKGFSDEAVMSIGALPLNNTQLLMTDPNKAFLPNKVALTSQLDVTTVPSPQTGMLVYNTVTVNGTNGVIPGLYVYENNKWQYLFTEDIKRLQMRTLQTSFVTPVCSSIDYACATLMDFGDDIIIPEEGAYGIGISLYGKPETNLTAPSREVLYVWLMVNDTPADVAELNPVGFTSGNQFTYTVFLGGQFSVGDKLSCRLSYYATYHPMYIDTSQTFMMYWRLEQASK